MIKTVFCLMCMLIQVVASIQPVHAQTPEIVEAAAPTYPLLPSGGRESGEIQVAISISASGEVMSAKAVSGPERLRKIAEDAALKWRFQIQGEPTQKATLIFGFKLLSRTGKAPMVAATFKKPNRVDVFAEEKQITTLADPAFEDVDKNRKKQKEH